MRHILILLLMGFVLGVHAQSPTVVTQTSKGVTRLTFYSPAIVRVEHLGENAAPAPRSLVVTMIPQYGLNVSVKESANRTVASSGNLTAVVDRQTGLVSFQAQGSALVKEKAFSTTPRPSVTYTLEPDEPIYGLGTLQDGKLSHRGKKRKLLEQSNLEDFQYVIQSVKGWGIYWDTYARADFLDSEEGLTFSPEVGDRMDYYLMFGGSADGVNRLMRQLSGEVPMFPLWTFGYWQCRERYKSAKELLEVVDWHRQNQVPLDGIIQDWQYWGHNYLWNAMDFLNEDFRNAERMVKRVHEQNAHLMISVWASFGPVTPQYKELSEQGLLFGFETWPLSGLSDWPPRREYPSGVRVYDAYSQQARDIYCRHLQKLQDYGIDAWWMDSTDPDQTDPTEADYDRPVGASPSLGIGPQGTYRSMRNAFPLATVSGVYDHLRKTDTERRAFIMTRSAFAGQQRYGAGLWSGDVQSTWDMLRKQIPLGLNYAMTGCPNFNTDIGGFFCGRYNTQGSGSAPRNPNYQELYVRWMQYGLFCPVFRSHGCDAPREIYQFGKRGDAAFDAIEATIRLRYRLLPYIYSTAWQVTSEGDSYQRALVYDFPGDRRTWEIGDEFMFGHSILALPVIRPQYTSEEVRSEAVDFSQEKSITRYLPKGATWYDFWTERPYRGGRDTTLPTRFDRAPMMVRSGSILPLAPVMQYAGEHSWDDLEIIVYPGQDGLFKLYEDEGDSYRYEQGQRSVIPFQWNERSRQLTIGQREGSYSGMPEQRTFRVRLAGSQQSTVVSYDGRQQRIKL